jgi:hypothetical protein
MRKYFFDYKILKIFRKNLIFYFFIISSKIFFNSSFSLTRGNFLALYFPQFSKIKSFFELTEENQIIIFQRNLFIISKAVFQSLSK